MSFGALPVLAFLGFSATEVGLVILVYVLLFGVDKVPDLARTVGRAQARVTEWKAEFDQEVERARWGEDLDSMRFEMERERRVREHGGGFGEEMQVFAAAQAMGIETEGLGYEEVRERLRERVGGPASGEDVEGSVEDDGGDEGGGSSEA